MSTFEILLVIFAAILAAAALGVVYRMVVGPTILDRAISSDSLVTLVVMGMALYAAHSEAAWAGPSMLALTGLAFIGTVTFARFVPRENPMQGRRPHHADEPHTDTGPHEAVHLDPFSSEAWDPTPNESPGPDNTLLSDEFQDPLTLEAPLEDPLSPGEPLEESGRPDRQGQQGQADQPGQQSQPGQVDQPGQPGQQSQPSDQREDSHPPEPFDDGDEQGFGAQPGSRGFEDERRRASRHGSTEEPR